MQKVLLRSYWHSKSIYVLEWSQVEDCWVTVLRTVQNLNDFFFWPCVKIPKCIFLRFLILRINKTHKIHLILNYPDISQKSSSNVRLLSCSCLHYDVVIRCSHASEVNFWLSFLSGGVARVCICLWQGHCKFIVTFLNENYLWFLKEDF